MTEMPAYIAPWIEPLTALEMERAMAERPQDPWPPADLSAFEQAQAPVPERIDRPCRTCGRPGVEDFEDLDGFLWLCEVCLVKVRRPRPEDWR